MQIRAALDRYHVEEIERTNESKIILDLECYL